MHQDSGVDASEGRTARLPPRHGAQPGGQFCTDLSSKEEQHWNSTLRNPGGCMDRLAEMVQYVRQKNIDRFRKLLDEPTDPLRQQQLQQQLAELEAAQQ